MNDYELTLFDRIEVIRKMNKLHDLENNAYISFSGGKDSAVVSALIDLALPHNRIPRVFINTGIEYNDIVAYVHEQMQNDDRIVELKPTQPIIQTLERYGYPFKSKEHAHIVHIYQNSGQRLSVTRYLGIEKGNKKILCPKKLRYQFTDGLPFKVSDLCCSKLKKQPAQKWAKANNKSIVITGMQKAEGGQRLKIGCVVFKESNLVKFHPLAPITNEFEEEFIKVNNIPLCRLYAPPFNFKRTGCKGCPFALDLQQQLETMRVLLPNEYKQCLLIWGKVYDEYIRINYRLKEFTK